MRVSDAQNAEGDEKKPHAVPRMIHIALARASFIRLRTAMVPSSVRLGRSLAIALTVVLLVFAGAVLISVWGGVAAKGWLGADFLAYQRFGAHFLATGVPYMPERYAGPWQGYGNQTNLYPPPALFLFIVFTVIPICRARRDGTGRRYL